MPLLVYLHGFMGSSKSDKARLTREWITLHRPKQSIWVPDLPYSPKQAIALIKAEINARLDSRTAERSAVFIGSSLGGYYANYLAEEYGSKAVLINPSVYPFELLRNYLGVQRSPYTGESFELTQQHMQELKHLYVDNMSRPMLRRVLLQTGDETLDYCQAAEYFTLSDCHIEPGGDHRFIDYENHLPSIAQFLLD